ncbi:retrotransposable element Tf2 protein type 1 [Trichonephila clavipes]|nr:retrotransposable element Tf2 protein type 1 [Trichonephila clavipes]
MLHSISSKFKKFLKHHNIRQLLTSANIPQCNGKNERVNQTLVAKLRCKVNSTTKTPWTKLLEQVTYEYNNSPHDVTGFPPAYLMFGTLPYDSPLPNQVKLNYPPIQQARQIAVNRTIKHHKINKQRHYSGLSRRNRIQEKLRFCSHAFLPRLTNQSGHSLPGRPTHIRPHTLSRYGMEERFAFRFPVTPSISDEGERILERTWLVSPR